MSLTRSSTLLYYGIDDFSPRHQAYSGNYSGVMPRIVDESQRHAEIGRAALSIAIVKGIDAVTFRSVAAEIGAGSTTAVTHYAPTRVDVLRLMLETLYTAGQEAIEASSVTDDPRTALADLVEAVLPTDQMTLGFARIAVDASIQITGHLSGHEELDQWGLWLYDRVEELVAEIAESDAKATSDAIVAMITGVTVSTLIASDYWTPDRQRAAAKAALVAHNLSAD